MEIIVLTLRNIVICLMGSIPGLLLSNFLEKNGIVRYQSKAFYIGLLVVITILISIFATWAHWSVYVIIALLVTTLGIQRFELWYSFRMGKWWWLKDKNNEQKAI